MDDVLVKAWSRSELQVLWYPPYRPNTDLALLRYQFLYGVGSPDITSFSNGSFLKPSNSLPLNGTIQGLLPGTTYEVAVLVCSEIGCDFFHMLPTMAMTFGLGWLQWLCMNIIIFMHIYIHVLGSAVIFIQWWGGGNDTLMYKLEIARSSK